LQEVVVVKVVDPGMLQEVLQIAITVQQEQALSVLEEEVVLKLLEEQEARHGQELHLEVAQEHSVLAVKVASGKLRLAAAAVAATTAAAAGVTTAVAQEQMAVVVVALVLLWCLLEVVVCLQTTLVTGT
jgi:hypothetical protein